ncbi:MAG: GNAT family N-acetyltransferase [Actinobacteria bacterium]|nr:GNAT family N-acetyltransferase [Actinomycetota bacterium]
MSAANVDEDLLRRLAANSAGAYRTWVDRLGKRTRFWDDLSCADLELAVALPVNGATLLTGPRDGAHDLLERAAAFFAERPGGPYELWSLWPLPRFSNSGHEGQQVPCMIREPGGSPPGAPADLEIVEVADASTARQAEWLIDEVFEARTVPGSLLALACLDDRFRVWLGRVDGRPVTTATAYIGDGFVGIYAVATAAHARGKGYAEAVTWSATLCRPELPATLQASQMGRPVYERMGYRTVAEFTVWELDR